VRVCPRSLPRRTSCRFSLPAQAPSLRRATATGCRSSRSSSSRSRGRCRDPRRADRGRRGQPASPMRPGSLAQPSSDWVNRLEPPARSAIPCGTPAAALMDVRVFAGKPPRMAFPLGKGGGQTLMVSPGLPSSIRYAFPKSTPARIESPSSRAGARSLGGDREVLGTGVEWGIEIGLVSDEGRRRNPHLVSHPLDTTWNRLGGLI
jgi:hypothetical protein